MTRTTVAAEKKELDDKSYAGQICRQEHTTISRGLRARRAILQCVVNTWSLVTSTLKRCVFRWDGILTFARCENCNNAYNRRDFLVCLDTQSALKLSRLVQIADVTELKRRRLQFAKRASQTCRFTFVPLFRKYVDYTARSTILKLFASIV